MENGISYKLLSAKYLDWCGKHRAPRTCEWYEGHLSSFLSHLGDNAENPASAMKPYHVVEWIDSKTTWGPTHSGNGITAIKRVYNWAEEMGYAESNPIKKTKKPQGKRREIYMTPEDYQQILALLSNTDPFRDWFMFAWYTGARPQEVRHIEPRHVELENERIVFPAEESKGKRVKRVIYLQGIALEIITRLMAEGREGKLFLNTDREPWSKFAICNRFFRISLVIGKTVTAYSMRHGFATRKIMQGISTHILAKLMGHSDSSMLDRVYSHIDKEADYLKAALQEVSTPYLAPVWRNLPELNGNPGINAEISENVLTQKQAQSLENMVAGAGIEPATQGL